MTIIHASSVINARSLIIVEDLVVFAHTSYTSFDLRVGAVAESGFETKSNGWINKIDSNSPESNVSTWYLSANFPVDYEIMMQYNSGAHINGDSSLNEDQWYTGNILRTWYMQAEIGTNDNDFAGTWRIRPAGGGGDIDTASVDMRAVTEV